MNNRSIELPRHTAIGLLETIFAAGALRYAIRSALGDDQVAAVESKIARALDQIDISSRSDEEFLSGVLGLLAESLKSAAPKTQRDERRDPMDGSDAGPETELSEIFAAIDDPNIVASAKMVALDVLLGSFSDDVCNSLGVKNRQSIRAALEKLKVDALGAFVSSELDVTLYAMEKIMAGLDAAEEHAETEINAVDLAATLRFVRVFSHKCRRQSAQRVGRDITEEIKASAASLYKRAYGSACGDKKKYHLAVIFEIKRLAAEIDQHLRPMGAQATPEQVGGG
jgi:hypothetical protein